MNEAASLCKTILRNGYDAYVISAALQKDLYERSGKQEVDIACEPDFETLGKMFPNLEHSSEEQVVATLKSEETGFLYRFYPTDINDASHPDVTLTRLTVRMRKTLQELGVDLYAAFMRHDDAINSDGIVDMEDGSVKLKGIPPLVLRRNYTLGILVLRIAANYDIPIEPNTWIALVQAAPRIGDFVAAREFVEEWRQVAAENMWRFVQLLADSTILHYLIPELASLLALRQNCGKCVDEEQSVFEHTISCMKSYPEENLHHDWIGVVAVMFMDVGKLHTAERLGSRWTFFQHHRVGAKITRQILRRLHFDAEEIDTICDLVRNQLRFQSMLTDRGIRRFKKLPDDERLIEIARANIKSQQDGNYTNFNHNLKYMKSRGDAPEQMTEPLLNGNEIMEYTGLPPGPEVGLIRDALLQAQIRGEVADVNAAVAFVRSYLNELQ